MENKIKNFYDLNVWKKGHLFTLEIYKITKDFPKDETYGIVSQLRRAASSITANIAEGFARYHFKDKIRFYYNSRGSIAEVLNFLLLARDLEYIDSLLFDSLELRINEVGKLLNGMIKITEEQIKNK